MTSETDERIQALEVAIQNEASEREFYLKHAGRTTHPLGERMFRTLADEELEHMERIQLLHGRLKDQGRWPEDLPLEIRGTRIKEVLESVVASVDLEAVADRDDLEAVRVAIDFETKGEAFYRDLAKKTDNTVEADFFLLLASMEHDHLISLKDTLEFFKDPQGWFVAKERHSLDGG